MINTFESAEGLAVTAARTSIRCDASRPTTPRNGAAIVIFKIILIDAVGREQRSSEWFAARPRGPDIRCARAAFTMLPAIERDAMARASLSVQRSSSQRSKPTLIAAFVTRCGDSSNKTVQRECEVRLVQMFDRTIAPECSDFKNSHRERSFFLAAIRTHQSRSVRCATERSDRAHVMAPRGGRVRR